MSEAIAKPRSKSLQRRDAKLALKVSKRYKRMQQREPAPKLTGKQRVLNWLLHIIMVFDGHLLPRAATVGHLLLHKDQ